MIIKLPKEVNKILKALEAEKFEAYTVGQCVRDSLLGLKPYGWDISTSAGIDDLKRIFTEGKVISEKYGVVRMEYIEENYDDEGEFLGETGIIVDVSTYRKAGNNPSVSGENILGESIEEDLERRDFTINAIADSFGKTVDIYQGREDLKKKLIKTIGEADKKFKQEPIKMLTAIRLAAELDFDLHKSVYEAITENWRLLENINKEKIRDEFTLLISAENAGKGLGMLMDTGILNVIIGEETVHKLTSREKSDFTVLCNNIDKTHQVEARRLGLFYTCIDKKKALPAIESMNFDSVTHQHLIDAINDMPKLHFTTQKLDLKQFIYKRGWDRYNYLVNLEKAQRIVFDYFNETKIKSKMYLVDEIKGHREPIFPEDLVIDANDLIEAGICERDETEKLLGMLVEKTHAYPNMNTRAELLKLAKKYKKSKLAAMTRGVHWLR